MRAYHGVTIALGQPDRACRSSTPTSTCRWRASCTPTARTTTATPSLARPRRSSPARLAGNLEEMIEREGPDTIAAFIAEPVMGAGGVIVPPKTYFEKMQAVLRQHDIAFIADEVICGFGRTGNWWGIADLRHRSRTPSRWPRRSPRPTCRSARSRCRSTSTRRWSTRARSSACSRTASPTPGIPWRAPSRSRRIEIYERIDIVGMCSGWRRSSERG